MRTRKQPTLEEAFHWSDKTVLVTGGTRGLGRALVERFSQAGARVVFTYRDDYRGASRLVRQFRSEPEKVIGLQTDVMDREQLQALFQTVRHQYSGLSTLINNAGVYPQSPLLEMSEDEWDTVIDTNLKAVHLCTQLAAKLMRGVPSASIVNIASIEQDEVAPAHAHYAASKAGVVMYTKSAAAELGPLKIRVNCVSPGLIARPGLQSAWPEGVERYTRSAALSRVGHAYEVADACLFLASDAARWITGSNLIVDGGVTTHSSY